MTPNVELDMRFTDLVVSYQRSIATFESDYCEDPEILVNTRNAYKQKFGPSAIEVRRQERIEDTPDGVVEHPVLVWTAIWEHGRVSTVPGLFPLHADYVFKYDLPRF